MTELQSAQLGIDISEGVCGTNVDPGGSVRRSGLYFFFTPMRVVRKLDVFMSL